MGNPIIERGPKVRVIASPSTWIEGEALRQLDAAAELPGMRSLVGMPDIQPGKGGPSGAAFLSDGWLHPTLVGSDIGCGVGLWITDMPLRKAKPDCLAERLDGLDSPWEGDATVWLAERGVASGLHDASLGTTGRGNHFLEIQAVHEVRDSIAFSELGMDDGLVYILVHSGSRGLGEAVLRTHVESYGSSALAAGSPEADAYLRRHDAAVLWAKANRELCAERALDAIGARGRRILDVCHNAVEGSDTGGCRCWLHRKGAAPSDRGLVVIPGSRGDLSALVRPLPSEDLSLRSLAHGAGRKIARHEARGKLRGLRRREGLKRNHWGGRVVCGDELLAWEEAPECYKPLASVVGDLEDAGLIKVVAMLRPLATFKTSEGARDEVRRSREDRMRRRRVARDAKLGGRWS